MLPPQHEGGLELKYKEIRELTSTWDEAKVFTCFSSPSAGDMDHGMVPAGGLAVANWHWSN